MFLWLYIIEFKLTWIWRSSKLAKLEDSWCALGLCPWALSVIGGQPFYTVGGRLPFCRKTKNLLYPYKIFKNRINTQNHIESNYGTACYFRQSPASLPSILYVRDIYFAHGYAKLYALCCLVAFANNIGPPNNWIDLECSRTDGQSVLAGQHAAAGIAAGVTSVIFLNSVSVVVQSSDWGGTWFMLNISGKNMPQATSRTTREKRTKNQLCYNYPELHHGPNEA